MIETFRDHSREGRKEPRAGVMRIGQMVVVSQVNKCYKTETNRMYVSEWLPKVTVSMMAQVVADMSHRSKVYDPM